MGHPAIRSRDHANAKPTAIHRQKGQQQMSKLRTGYCQNGPAFGRWLDGMSPSVTIPIMPNQAAPITIEVDGHAIPASSMSAVYWWRRAWKDADGRSFPTGWYAHEWEAGDDGR